MSMTMSQLKVIPLLYVSEGEEDRVGDGQMNLESMRVLYRKESSEQTLRLVENL